MKSGNDQDLAATVPAQRSSVATPDLEAIVDPAVEERAADPDIDTELDFNIDSDDDIDGRPDRGLDQTFEIPRPKLEPPAVPKVSAWDAEPAVRAASPVVGAPFGRERALGTLAWIFSAVIMASLALIRLNWASMRAAELSAWGFTSTPARLIPRLVRDTDPGDVPYFLCLKAWAAVFGRADFSLRLPSVILMAAAVALSSMLATRLAGPRAGAMTGLLLALVPVTSRYAQEAGPQAMTVFGAVLATMALVAMFDRPRFWQIAGYAVAVALMSLGHITGLLVVLAHAVIVLSMKRRVAWKWLIGAVFGAAPTVALLVYSGGRPLRAPGAQLTAAFPPIDQLVRGTMGAVVLGGVVMGFGLFALSTRKPAMVFTAWAILPLILLYPVVRYTTFSAEQVEILVMPAWVALAGLGLSRAPVVRGAVAVLVVAAIGIPTQMAVREPDGHGQSSHALADVIYTQGKPDDVIVYGPANGDGPAGRDVVYRYLSAAHRPKDVLAEGTPRADGHLRVPECPDVDSCLGKPQRVWLVRVGSFDSPLTGLEAGKDGALRVRYTVAQSWNLTGLSLVLYTLKPKS